MVEEMKENTVELDGDTKEDVGSVSEGGLYGGRGIGAA